VKKILFILLITLATTILHAQDVYFEWAKQMGGSGSLSVGHSIATDASGNVYTTGFFNGTVDFDPGAGVFNLTSGGIFISKLSAAGDLIWAKQMVAAAGTGSGEGHSIAVDAAGNVYTTGFFTGTVDFDPGPGSFNLTSSGEIFISKLDAAGNFAWAKQMLTIAAISQNRLIVVDAAGNVYTTGTFFGTVDFDPGAGVFNLSSAGFRDIFVSKLDAAGNFVWAKQMGGSGLADDARGYSIAIDGSGNIYTTGEFSGTVDFDPGTGVFNLNSSGVEGIFVSKLDAAGNFAWAKRIGGTLDVVGYSIAVDGPGNIYTTGYFGGTADFDPGPAVFEMSATASNNVFVSKIDASGNFILAKQFGGPGSSGGSSISLDATGNIYTTGSFSRTVDFDPGPGTYNLNTIGINEDMFVSKLDMNGNLIWAKQMGGGISSYAAGNSIALDAFRNIYTTGSFSITVDFDPGFGVFNLTSRGVNDMFVHKMSQCTNSSTSSIISASTCSTYTLNGQTYSASGTYTQTLTNETGCDSIITINLTINRINTAIDVASCKSYAWNNQTYTTSGSYTDTLIAAGGCDSIVTLYLTIAAKLSSTINHSICPGQTYSGYSTSGTYMDTLMAANGCDSIRTLQLTVLSKPAPDLGIDKNLCSGDSALLYPGQFTNYSWQDGSTQSRFTVKQPGLYSVMVTDNCGSASDEIMITESNCDIYFPTGFTPNNDGKNDLFKILGGYNLKDYRLVIYNRWGQKVFETVDFAKGWNGSFNGQMPSSATFVWYCEFIKPGNASKTKMKGTVTLIR